MTRVIETRYLLWPSYWTQTQAIKLLNTPDKVKSCTNFSASDDMWRPTVYPGAKYFTMADLGANKASKILMMGKDEKKKWKEAKERFKTVTNRSYGFDAATVQ